MVTTTQRVANQVHSRREDPVETKLTHLITDALSHLEGSLTIPRGCQCHRSHKVGGIILTMIPWALSAHAQTLLRVGAIGFRNTQATDGERATSSARKLSFIIEVHTSAQYHMTLFFECHRFHHFINSFSL